MTREERFALPHVSSYVLNGFALQRSSKLAPTFSLFSRFVRECKYHRRRKSLYTGLFFTYFAISFSRHGPNESVLWKLSKTCQWTGTCGTMIVCALNALCRLRPTLEIRQWFAMCVIDFIIRLGPVCALSLFLAVYKLFQIRRLSAAKTCRLI